MYGLVFVGHVIRAFGPFSAFSSRGIALLFFEAMFRALVRRNAVSPPFVDASGPVRSRWSVDLACTSFGSGLLFRLVCHLPGVMLVGVDRSCFALGVVPDFFTLVRPPFRLGLAFRLRVVFAGYGVGCGGCPCFHWLSPRIIVFCIGCGPGIAPSLRAFAHPFGPFVF